MNHEGKEPAESGSSLIPHPSSFIPPPSSLIPHPSSLDSLNHPGDEALRALSLGKLTEADLAHVCSHLADCPECCRRIDQLATDDRLLARLQQDDASGEKVLVGPAQRRSVVRALRHSHKARAATLHPPPSTLHPVNLPIPRQVGDYDILAEVGRGGMGVVYKARHRGLHRLTALKMVLAGEFASPTQELRFRLEAELAARVQHPNIVQVYEIGSFEGRPFLALEWVEGGSVANRLDGKPWLPGEAAALIETLARAIDVAHSEGVVHRDLKPANILMGRDDGEGAKRDEGGGMRDEVKALPSFIPHPSSLILPHSSLIPVPKIADFGLAQPIEGGQTMTQSGFLVGTPGYMAPEQASGKRALVGPATDIYALGVILYQLLTGQLPFQGDSTLELLRAVTSDEPPRPRRLQPRLPRDLEAITLHCLEKEPSRRYPSALALAEDLQRFRERKQVLARPVGAVGRLVRACRRRPLVGALCVLLVFSLIGGLSGVTWKWLEANAHARQAEDEKQAAIYQAYRASLAAASAALQNSDVVAAARNLKSAPESLQDWEWRHLSSRLDDSSTVVSLPAGGQGFLLAPLPSPPMEGEDRVRGGRIRAGVVTSAGVRLLDLESGEHRTVPLHPEHRRDGCQVYQTCLGVRVVAWVGNTAFEVLDEAGEVLCRNRPTVAAIRNVVISPNGTRLAVQVGATRIEMLDASSGKQTAIWDTHQNSIWTYCFSPDSSLLASGGEDRTARVWDAAKGTLLATCQGHTSKVLCAAFSPDGSHLVTASADGTVRQWDPRTGLEVGPPYERHTNEVSSAVYSPDGQLVASAGFDKTVRVWRARDRQDVTVLHGHKGGVTKVAFAADGRRLVSLSTPAGVSSAGDDTIRVWEVDPRTTLPVLRGHTDFVYPVAYSPDGRWLASGSWDKTVRLWDAATGEPCAILPHPSFVLDLAFGPDGTWLVTGCYHGDRLRIWDVATAQVRREIPLPSKDFSTLTVSPDGTRVAASLYDPDTQKPRRLIVYEVASGKPLFSTEGASLAYSPDGRWLAATAADDKTVLLLDALTHETSARFSGHEHHVFKAAFSPDSRHLATCSGDHTVRLWQIGSGACQVLPGHTDEVFAAAFHPGGTRLATGGRDGAVWLWDLARGEAVVQLPGHRSYIWSLAFSPDGATLASGSGDNTVRLWDTAPLKSRYQARREAAALRPEAEQLIARLWGEKNDAAEVMKTLRADQALSEPLRHAALRALLRRAQPPETVPGNPGPP